jgi:muramoyltetrapeptide carboxypeptidase
MRIAVVAPANRCPDDVPDRVRGLATRLYGDAAPEIVFHPQCFLQSGHFAGTDREREDALVECANDPSFDAIWFARGGYGSNRIAQAALDRMNRHARRKAYVGFSDMGFLLAGLLKRRIGKPVHGPMPASVTNADRGEEVVQRSLDWLMGRRPSAPFYFGTLPQFESPKCIALNLSVLAALLNTPLQPSFRGRILLVEEVGEEMYRIDRLMFQVTSNPAVRQCAGLMLGRCAIKPNTGGPDWGPTDEVEVAERWCKATNIPYLGRADIGHDADNKVVPFG